MVKHAEEKTAAKKFRSKLNLLWVNGHFKLKKLDGLSNLRQSMQDSPSKLF